MGGICGKRGSPRRSSFLSVNSCCVRSWKTWAAQTPPLSSTGNSCRRMKSSSNRHTTNTSCRSSSKCTEMCYRLKSRWAQPRLKSSFTPKSPTSPFVRSKRMRWQTSRPKFQCNRRAKCLTSWRSPRTRKRSRSGPTRQRNGSSLRRIRGTPTTPAPSPDFAKIRRHGVSSHSTLSFPLRTCSPKPFEGRWTRGRPSCRGG
mmetsp:Transcript_110037/g.187286  ORF Transcript_110037/g.187286 Transcript_110037/m.187286 type:complete len:201 (-) Transcript_110037:194-796(-)